MFLVVMGYDDRTVEENLFTRWFSAGLGLIVLSLGEYEVHKATRVEKDGIYLQVNALSERIIRIYLHEFTNNERENSIPHEAAECGIENFEFIVSERVQVNPDNSRAMSALTFLLFKLNTLQTKIVKL